MILGSNTPKRTFATDATWTAIEQLLREQLLDVDVDTIGAQDFDEDGMLVVRPPAARVYFAEETLQSIETQSQSYNADQFFGIICSDADLSADPQNQRLKSVGVATRVQVIVTGARLQLADGTQTDPIACLGTKPLPASTGMAYVVGVKVSGCAQFPAPNAVPQGGQ